MPLGRKTMAKRRTYTREFKIDAVRVLRTSGKSQAQVARDLGIPASCLSHWKREYAEEGTEAFPGQGRLKPEDEEIRRLRRELEIAQQERDILKKAVAIFSHLRE
jgi:transposase